MEKINPQIWKEEMQLFAKRTREFYDGKLSKGEYKGFSGRYGSYAQRGAKASMLRLRMTAGCLSKEKLAFVAEMIRKYHLNKIHFTTCQTIQLHDLDGDTVSAVMQEALAADIVTMGGGGDYPRNVMCSPLSGVEKGECFDVLPWARQAGEYLLHLIDAKKMSRKLKVGFSNSPQNLTHATFRDLGFAAREDGTFDVYSAGGLGNNPRMGIKVAEGIEPEDILYYTKAMWLTFLAYGNYENRGRARTRYMPERLGGEEAYRAAYLEKLEEVFASGEDLRIGMKEEDTKVPHKIGDGSRPYDDSAVKGEECAWRKRVLAQKQEGLYAVAWHPIGGMAAPEILCALSDAVQEMEDVQLRLTPDQGAYIINLTGAEAKRMLELTEDSARTVFETSVACIGAGICQIGLRDSQKLLVDCVKAVREAKIADGALPQIHISGCPSSCGTHQIGKLGFRGAGKPVNGKPQSAFMLFVGGREAQGNETLGHEIGTILETDIPQFLVKLGREVQKSGLDFAAWEERNPKGLEQIAAEYAD